MTMSDRKIIELEPGWKIIQTGITKLQNFLEREGISEEPFDSKERMDYYTTIYNMCMQKPPHDYSQQLYDRYRESFEEYINSMMESSAEQRKVIPEYNQ